MLLRLDNAFFNPGIKGLVPADKSTLISKGSQHLLIKRCVGPYPTLLNILFGLVGAFPPVVHSHAERGVFVIALRGSNTIARVGLRAYRRVFCVCEALHKWVGEKPRRSGVG